jgi:hypothetical protein
MLPLLTTSHGSGLTLVFVRRCSGSGSHSSVNAVPFGSFYDSGSVQVFFKQGGVSSLSHTWIGCISSETFVHYLSTTTVITVITVQARHVSDNLKVPCPSMLAPVSTLHQSPSKQVYTILSYSQ